MTMNIRSRESKRYTIKESYRKQAYVGVVSLDLGTNSWAWKGHVDFNEGLHSMFTNRTFTTAMQAEDHMRQFAHQCIDNRLNAGQPYGF
ncbi:MAG: hypothetical protein E6J74_24320 [Deltaproteobacteria bacterium]|nr:MAG: hypothetical protein E6J74_24320 [Deltaproteobacteria bacterium]